LIHVRDVSPATSPRCGPADRPQQFFGQLPGHYPDHFAFRRDQRPHFPSGGARNTKHPGHATANPFRAEAMKVKIMLLAS
jgi:hypothetical protein